VQATYEYLLPTFVGHPFQADHTEALRAIIETTCNTLNSGQSGEKHFFWKPEFLHTLEKSRPETILDAVRESIRQSALCIFDISEATNANVFFELGLAVGMRRALVLLGKKPFYAPSDLQGIRGIEYTDMDDLGGKLEQLMWSRLHELQRPPEHGQDIIHQKMQIDANWRNRIRHAGKSIYFFAGDLSWAEEYSREIKQAVDRGITVLVCCREPRAIETRKWANIDTLRDSGALIRLYDSGFDPKVRGFVVDAEDLNEHTEIMLVDKEARFGNAHQYDRTGITVGESQYLYKAHIYRGHLQIRQVAAFIRLFEFVWDHPSSKRYS
jgi:hypothetical protein